MNMTIRSQYFFTNGGDYIDGLAGDDFMLGGSGNDFIFGGSGNDSLYSGLGKDQIDGGSGDDAIYCLGNSGLYIGGDGNDYMVSPGLRNNEKMDGETGADIFRYLSISGSPNNTSRDTIQYFSHNEGDKIDISGIDANVLQAGKQSFAPGQLIWNPATHILVADVIGGADWSVNLVGVQPGFSPMVDVIS